MPKNSKLPMHFMNNHRLQQYWIGVKQTDSLKRSLCIALVVGTLLNIIHHEDAIFRLELDIIKTILTYVVPFIVSLLSGVVAHISCLRKLNEVKQVNLAGK